MYFCLYCCNNNSCDLIRKEKKNNNNNKNVTNNHLHIILIKYNEMLQNNHRMTQIVLNNIQ